MQRLVLLTTNKRYMKSITIPCLRFYYGICVGSHDFGLGRIVAMDYFLNVDCRAECRRLFSTHTHTHTHGTMIRRSARRDPFLSCKFSLVQYYNEQTQDSDTVSSRLVGWLSCLFRKWSHAFRLFHCLMEVAQRHRKQDGDL